MSTELTASPGIDKMHNYQFSDRPSEYVESGPTEHSHQLNRPQQFSLRHQNGFVDTTRMQQSYHHNIQIPGHSANSYNPYSQIYQQNSRPFNQQETPVPPVPNGVCSERCSYCPMMFDKKSDDYKFHLKSYHKHVYETCQMAPGHMVPSVEIKKHSCPVCFQPKKNARDMTKCIKFHKDNEEREEQPTEFKCPEPGCDLKYELRKTLLAHCRQKHSMTFKAEAKAEWTSTCKFCARKFRYERSLIGHEQKFCPVRPEALKEASAKAKVKKKRVRKTKTKTPKTSSTVNPHGLGVGSQEETRAPPKKSLAPSAVPLENVGAPSSHNSLGSQPQKGLDAPYHHHSFSAPPQNNFAAPYRHNFPAPQLNFAAPAPYHSLAVHRGFDTPSRPIMAAPPHQDVSVSNIVASEQHSVAGLPPINNLQSDTNNIDLINSMDSFNTDFLSDMGETVGRFLETTENAEKNVISNSQSSSTSHTSVNSADGLISSQ